MENLEQAIFDYENHFIGICELSQKYKIPNKMIRTCLEEKGYNLGKGVSPKSVVNIKRAVDEYIKILNSGEEPNIYRLSQKYQVSHTGIKDNLNRLNIKVIRYPKKIQFDETVFDTIDTDEKAYWLGFFSADGYICKRYNTVGIALSDKDADHVKKFAKFLGCPENVKFKKVGSYGKCTCEIGNAHLKRTLMNYGFTSTKSYDLTFPNINIFKDPKLINAFIRGNFDGDGSITFSKHFRKRTEDLYCAKVISFVGTKQFIEGIQEHFNLYDSTIYQDRDHMCYEIRTQSKAQYILNIIYKDASVYLDRKYKLYKIAPHFVWTNAEKPFNIEELCDENIEIISEVKI